jgi:hypothetical protein
MGTLFGMMRFFILNPNLTTMSTADQNLRTKMEVGIALGIGISLMRFSIDGWMIVIGIISIVFFGVLHLFLWNWIRKYASLFSPTQRNISWVAIAIYPLIFLFQADFDDGPGTYFVFESIIGFDNYPAEDYIGIVSVLSSFIYIGIFSILLIGVLRIRKTQKEGK